MGKQFWLAFSYYCREAGAWTCIGSCTQNLVNQIQFSIWISSLGLLIWMTLYLIYVGTWYRHYLPGNFNYDWDGLKDQNVKDDGTLISASIYI